MDSILTLRDIQHQYNGRTVLDIPALDIRQGSIIGLTGANGSGKSTLLKILALTEKSSAGTTYLHGKPAAQLKPEERWRIALLTQDPYLLKRTVHDNISYGLKIRGKTENLTAAVHSALGMVGLSSAFADRYWHALSGGEKQRVALAARLILHPDCLLLDEPTASVDMDSAIRIRQAMLAARRDRGTTLVVASHHRSWLNEICDDLLCLFNGRILEGGIDNILLGPWKRADDGNFGQQLADGQWIYASPPPHGGNSATISPENLLLTPFEARKDYNLLHGTVNGVFFEKHAPGPRIHVMCGDQCFIAGVVKDIFRMDSCRPGTQVILRYRPADITWLPD